MFLYAGGCSMTYGSEMVHPSDHHVDANPHLTNMRIKYAWPGLLADKLKCIGHTNDGVGGQTNETIAYKAHRWITDYINNGNDPQQLFVMINWTHMGRMNFFDNHSNSVRTIHYGHNPPEGYTKDQKTMWKYMDATCKDELVIHWKTFTTLVAMLQAVLDKHNIAYAMAYGVDSSFKRVRRFMKNNTHEEKQSVLSATTHFINRSRFLGLREINVSMTDTLYTNNLRRELPGSLAPNGHPWADGHLLWADVLYEWIKNNELLRRDNHS